MLLYPPITPKWILMATISPSLITLLIPAFSKSSGILTTRLSDLSYLGLTALTKYTSLIINPPKMENHSRYKALSYICLLDSTYVELKRLFKIRGELQSSTSIEEEL
jgi:hypothetical protein